MHHPVIVAKREHGLIRMKCEAPQVDTVRDPQLRLPAATAPIPHRDVASTDRRQRVVVRGKPQVDHLGSGSCPLWRQWGALPRGNR